MCDLVFAHPDSYLSPEEEFKRYQQHNNDSEDPRYRSFLGKLQKPMAKRLTSKSSGLDFGSGPGPLLKKMFEEQGHKMSIYDVFYAPDMAVFETNYNFITSSETVEHLQQPLLELDRLWHRLKPDGILGIMTGIHYKDIDFKNWYYIRDETHVVFFSPKTFEWLAQYWDANLDFIGDSVVIFQKTSGSATSLPKKSEALLVTV
ncbi:MAG: class I SAM-dependent methyltransferase [Candidatus Marinimicrobia bacterium]|nr:class I SAM-dependent methyltransferase [Candidatus Neomarinimicrobiota bacterium]